MKVLRALAAEPGRWRYGYELGAETGLKAGSLYPILVRLADRELLEASWEDSPPHGRPARHLYRLTADGLELASLPAPAGAARAVPAPSPSLPGLGIQRPRPPLTAPRTASDVAGQV